MKQSVKIGVVCLARKSFDFNAALEIFKNIQKDLHKIINVDWEIIENLVIEIEEAQKAANHLASVQIDGLIVISGTFHLGHLVLELNKAIQKPLLLWALYELPYNGGKIRLNSICGLNLNSSILYKAGVRNYHYIVDDKVDEDWIDAIRVLKSFKTAKIGIAGFHAYGFFNLDVDELALSKETGITVEHHAIQEIFNETVTEEEISKWMKKEKEIFNTSTLNDFQIKKVAELAAKMNKFIERTGITALAIRCWPEHAAEFGISPCATMSLLQTLENRIIACEGDILGAVSMVAHKAIGAETPFFADFSQVDFKNEFALLWHCGVAPCGLWDGKCDRSLDTYFAGGKGVTADFILKPGKLSIMRIDSVGQEFRIFLQDAEGVPMNKDLKGTSLKAVFKEPVRAILDKIVSNGIAHHTSVVYGDFKRPMELYAKIKNWRIIK
jgi:L-fucose isomerase-like protein